MDGVDSRVSGLYIHVQRLTELLDRMPPGHLATSGDAIQKGLFFGRVTDSVVGWLKDYRIPTLGQIVLEDKLVPGALFTHFGTFRCSGMSAYLQGRRSNLPEIYLDLGKVTPGLKVVARIDPVHTTSTSAAGEFRNQQRFFILALVSRREQALVEIKPYFIGLIVDNVFGHGTDISLPRWRSFGEIWPGEIDQFKEIERIRTGTLEELQVLKSFPEQKIKAALAEIIGEPFVPKDWGGETSDFFSARLSVGGAPVAASFLLKGPSKFHPMKLPDLGANGDQIVRMFYDPADIFVVQHCHKVTLPVRIILRCLANQIGRTRLFCVIDGPDTLRILRAYGKIPKRSSSLLRRS